MGLFDRMSKLFKANANAAIDKMSDPSKEIDQLILEMEEQLRKGRQETVKCKATEKLCAQRVTDLEKQVGSWQDRAEAAVRAGDDELAKTALGRKAEVEMTLGDARREMREAGEYASRLQEQLARGEQKLKIYKAKKGTIQAKAGMVKRQTTVTADAFEDFDRMAGKVDDAEVAVEVERDLASTEAKDAEVENKLAKLSGGSAMDDRLAALKAKMEKKP